MANLDGSATRAVDTASISRVVFDSGWRMLGDAQADGRVISDPNGAPDPRAMDAVVPGTVLATLIKHGVLKDPYIGANLAAIADQDAFIAGIDVFTCWYIHRFKVEQALPAGGRAWLVLHGVNYQADVFLNGKPASASPFKGMFSRHELDITDIIRPGQDNVVAIKVTPPPQPGNPFSGGHRDPYKDKSAPINWPSVCQGGDFALARVVTAQFSGGWDFSPYLVDRNTGLWDHVELVFTGPVRFAEDPRVTSNIAWPTRWPGDRTTPPESATINAEFSVSNLTSRDVECAIEVSVGDAATTVSATLAMGATTTVPASLEIKNPKLWWPHGHGEQPLYPVSARLLAKSGPSDPSVASDHYACEIGIREITSLKCPIDVPDLQTAVSQGSGAGPVGRVFFVNRLPIYIRGGAWTFPDAMLRHSPDDYDAQIRLHKQANLNMIRIWGGGIIERPGFHDACDRNGILVWQEFPMSADGLEGGDPTRNPGYSQAYLDCARDAVLLLRNHASLALWVGCNEGFKPPPAKLMRKASALIQELDPAVGDMGSRFVDFSTDGNAGLGPTDGPYDILEPYKFFAAGDTDHEIANLNVFNPEFGSVGFPVVESLRRFMDAEGLDVSKVLVRQSTFLDLPHSWYLHNYIPFFSGDVATADQVLLYGWPATIEAFCEQAQAAQYQQYKALFEAQTLGMWKRYSGGVLWRSQPGWPGLRGGLYDAYLEPTGGLFGVRQAGQAVNIVLNLKTLMYEVVNNTDDALPSGLPIEVTFCDASGKVVGAPSTLHTSAAVSVRAVGGAVASGLTDRKVFRVARAVLKDMSGKTLARNLDWLGDTSFVMWDGATRGTKPGPFQPLRELAPVTLTVAAKGTRDQTGACTVSIDITNPGDTLAFFNRLRVVERGKPDTLVPALPSDNYMTLLPNETMSVEVLFQAPGPGAMPEITLSGWNSGTGTDGNIVPVAWSIP